MYQIKEELLDFFAKYKFLLDSINVEDNKIIKNAEQELNLILNKIKEADEDKIRELFIIFEYEIRDFEEVIKIAKSI